MTTQLSLLINGEKVAGNGASFDVINPADETILVSGKMASTDQLDQAVAAARQAFATWRTTPEAERSALLHRIADRIEANADELARIIVQEQGKPLFLAQVEVGGAVAWTRYNADLEIPVKVIEDSDEKRIEGHRKPLGVVASITPWNWPLMIAIWHIMPALRTGNTVVCKPSGMTPLNTLRLVEIVNEVLPAGVVNLVLGEREIGEAISRHQDIDKIIFTGSTPTGQDIMTHAAGNLKRLTLELGGNDAGIVLPGTDVNAVAEGIFNTSFINMGQTCAALKRLYVHDSLYDSLCSRLADLAQAQVVGDGLEEGTTFGPVQNAAQFNIVRELVEDARAKGGRILSGGEPVNGKGYFYPPTIVADVSNGVRLVDEEQFGPALPVIRYSDVDEAIRMANDCPFGLGGSVWGSDLDEAERVARQLESGTVWINNHAEVLPHAPFGGCKLSGCGVEFGVEGLLEYTQLQVINLRK
ncbi:aldehyde dehydrogenase family protein [Marinobacter halodurans]|uniref:Aldehyde dehydrogenase family protein n=1 Tax=Marinobacter halodurans TaxID=2528979 RepID=A0ABY1ZQP6_9GAMM|nr:aldehyde dehydrogenase family protein [Marinobacter halodurans]TBW58177.1 aldehyde dehydrogenase family protein [Marinobacter halodurans]